jgi:hypothetical protein
MESVPSEQPVAPATSKPLSDNSPLPGRLRDSAAIRRLLEEVRYEEINGSSAAAAYDRAHNRHNR